MKRSSNDNKAGCVIDNSTNIFLVTENVGVGEEWVSRFNFSMLRFTVQQENTTNY